MTQKNNYISLSQEVQDRIREDRKNHVENPYAFSDEKIVRRDVGRDTANLWRPGFVRDCEKIMHTPYYNRYQDKTQVFSLFRNDDITRRSVHVQLVSRIARNIGKALNLNLDLIEAISLGHDIGHTPFGHAVESKLSDIYHARTGKYFNHNIQSARILDEIYSVNLSLQTLDGIICHNGEMEQKRYQPKEYSDFTVFDEKVNACLTTQDAGKHIVPNTLEGCVMRVADIIAYLGKDRQDAIRLGIITEDTEFADWGIGTINAEIINNMSVNIIENSYGKPYLNMDDNFFHAFSVGKKENYAMIYKHDVNTKVFDEQIYPMLEEMYERLLADLQAGKKESPIFVHHIDYINSHIKHYGKKYDIEKYSPDDIVVDYIASMTDDYFVDFFDYLFPHNKYKIEYVGYFD